MFIYIPWNFSLANLKTYFVVVLSLELNWEKNDRKIVVVSGSIYVETPKQVTGAVLFVLKCVSIEIDLVDDFSEFRISRFAG